MLRLRLDFAYDGAHFHGWASQPGLRTVQAELEGGLTTVLRGAVSPVTVAGRTDAGVHATGAVAHVDVAQEAWGQVVGRSQRSPSSALVRRLAGVLPRDLVVRRVTEVTDSFDARFSALRRHYRYLLCDRPHELDPRLRGMVATHRRELEVEPMQQAAQVLLGLQDFSAFCKRREGASTVRTLEEFSWRRRDDGLIDSVVVADAFCHSMVRSLVGGVLPVGEGRRDAQWLAEVLTGGQRRPDLTVVPARGLTLERVDYPAQELWGQRQRQARVRRDEA